MKRLIYTRIYENEGIILFVNRPANLFSFARSLLTHAHTYPLLGLYYIFGGCISTDRANSARGSHTRPVLYLNAAPRARSKKCSHRPRPELHQCSKLNNTRPFSPLLLSFRFSLSSRLLRSPITFVYTYIYI